MKYCIIRRVPFKLPGHKSRIVWGHILCEVEGLALVLVPKPETDQPHSIFIAAENIADHVFESVGPYRFNLETDDLREVGEKFRMLGKSFWLKEFEAKLNLDDFL